MASLGGGIHNTLSWLTCPSSPGPDNRPGHKNMQPAAVHGKWNSGTDSGEGRWHYCSIQPEDKWHTSVNNTCTEVHGHEHLHGEHHTTLNRICTPWFHEAFSSSESERTMYYSHESERKMYYSRVASWGLKLDTQTMAEEPGHHFCEYICPLTRVRSLSGYAETGAMILFGR